MSKEKIPKSGLLPCPFCARHPQLIQFAPKLWTVACKCGAEAPKDSVSIEGIKRIWNRRRYVKL